MANNNSAITVPPPSQTGVGVVTAPSQAQTAGAQDIASCPPGMEPIIDMTVVKIKIAQKMAGSQVSRVFDIIDKNTDMRLFHAGDMGQGNITIVNASGRVVLTCQITPGGGCCGGGSVEVYSGNGNDMLIGSAKEERVGQFWLRDSIGLHQATIFGRRRGCDSERTFSVMSETMNGVQLGAIHNRFSDGSFGYNLDNSSVKFPVHPNTKCVLLGAAFLMNARYYERT